MAVQIPQNSGYAPVTLTNADSTAVSNIQSSNSGQPTGDAFNQFAGVVQGDQDTLQQMRFKMTALESAQSNGQLTPDQQKEYLGDVQQYEQAAEKFKSDSAHLVQLAAADKSTPEALEASAMGNTVASTLQATGSAISSSAHSPGFDPSIASAIDTANHSISDQASAIQNNDNLLLPVTSTNSAGSTSTVQTSAGTLGADGANLLNSSSGTRVGITNLVNVDPSTVNNLRSTNAGQPQGQAFAGFAQVVQGDQAQLNGLAASLNTLSKSDPNTAATVQKYEKAAEKFVGDQAHLLQLAAADGSTYEVEQARAFANPQVLNMGQIAAAINPGSSATPADRAAMTTAASSIQDQANALAQNNIASVPASTGTGNP